MGLQATHLYPDSNGFSAQCSVYKACFMSLCAAFYLMINCVQLDAAAALRPVLCFWSMSLAVRVFWPNISPIFVSVFKNIVTHTIIIPCLVRSSRQWRIVRLITAFVIVEQMELSGKRPGAISCSVSRERENMVHFYWFKYHTLGGAMPGERCRTHTALKQESTPCLKHDWPKWRCILFRIPVCLM